MSPARFLELYFATGGDCYLRADGKVVFTAPKILLEAVIPQIKALGREAILAELARENKESRERLAQLLNRDLSATSPGEIAASNKNPLSATGETLEQ